MNRFVTVWILSMFCGQGISQKIPLINSKEVISKAKQLYDSGKYELAARGLLTVPKRDTNYMFMLSELAQVYLADKKYELAGQVCEEALTSNSSYRSLLLRVRATAVERGGDFDKALILFEDALEEYPFDVPLRFNLGIAYHNHKDYDLAIATYFKTLSINPFHSGSHLNLGRIAVGQGKRAHAMFALGIFLGINNKDNERLVLLDKFVGNQLEEDGGLPAPASDACDRLDQIIKAKISMDKSFRSVMPINAPVVRQFEMLFKQLNTVDEDANEPWIQFYLPVYRAIGDGKNAEAFLYHILTSTTNDDVKKWRQKNEKALNTFYGVVNKALSGKRDVLEVPSRFGFSRPTRAWFDRSHRLEAIGERQGESNKGRWVYFHSSGRISAEGNFNDTGTKVGVWKYFYDDGSPKSIEDEGTGQVTKYFQNGGVHQKFILKDGLISGEAIVFYPCGALRERLTYIDGKRSGPGEMLYPRGKPDLTYEYVNDLENGKFESFFENDQLFNRRFFRNGKLNGKYEEYYADGKLKARGEYSDHKLTGAWEYFHANGALERKGVYHDDLGIGEWLYYFPNGQLQERRVFNEKGELDGDDIFYDNGTVHFIQTFRAGVLIGLTYFDAKGEELGRFTNASGNFAAKLYYRSGDLFGVGEFKGGEKSGAWTFYFPNGSKSSEYNYEDGELEGKGTDYHHNGQVKFIAYYKGNELHGYFQEFFDSGQVKQEGWFQDGERQQQWLTYTTDGTLESDYYYINGKLHKDCLDFNTDGRISSRTTYDFSLVIGYEDYDSGGKPILTEEKQGYSRVFTVRSAKGVALSRFELLCGNYSGSIEKKYPDGTPFYSYPLLNGERHGHYRFYDVSGALETEGRYVNGDREGLWKYFYTNGKPEQQGRFLSNQRDSTWEFYYPEGQLSSTAEFRYDKRHGVSIYYAHDGTVIVQKQYENGEVTGFRTFGPDKQLGEWKKFTGEGAIVANHSSGTKAYEANYKQGVLDGSRRTYFASGKLQSEYLYQAGNYHGPYRIYHPNGKLHEKGEYRLDERHGVVEVFDQEGGLLTQKNYVLGVLNGPVVLYRQGRKEKEFTFWSGMPEP